MTVTDRAYWLADQDGTWSIAGNWATQVPGSNPATYTAAVPSEGVNVSLVPFDPATGTATGTSPFTIMFDTIGTVYTLTGPGFATLAIAGGSLTVSSFMVLDGAVTLSSAGTLTLENGPRTVSSTVRGRFTNAGTVKILSGGMAFNGPTTSSGRLIAAAGTTLTVGGSFENQTGGTIDLMGDAEIAAGSGAVITNTGGTLIKEVGTGRSLVMPTYNGTSGVINVRSGTLDFEGDGNVFADKIVGAGTFSISNGARAQIRTGTITTKGFTLSTAFVQLFANVRYDGTFRAINDGNLLLRGVTLTLTGDATLMGGSNLFDDANYVTEGTLVVRGTASLGNLVLAQGVFFVNTGTVTQIKDVALRSGFPNAPGKIANQTGSSYNFAADVSLQGDTIALFENQGGTLAKTAGSGISSLTASLVGGGGKIRVDSGTLLLGGVSSQLTAQTISGAGTFALGGGVDYGTPILAYTLIDAGTTITTAAFAVSGLRTVVALGEDLAYTGRFTQSGGSTINLRDHTLTLSGSATFPGGTGSGQAIGITGAGTLALGGTTTITYANILASVQVINTGSVSQSRILGLGDASNGAAAIVNAAGATWALGNGAVIAGTSASSFDNAGTLAKTTGTGHALVDTAIINTSSGVGRIAASAGTLELGGTLSGRQALKAGTGASLVLDRSVTADSSFEFGGTDATLQLSDAQDYHGTIAGFAASETLDLHSIGFGSGITTTLGYSGDSSGGMLTVSDGTRTASLAMLGSYSQASFALGSDGHGGSAVTFA